MSHLIEHAMEMVMMKLRKLNNRITIFVFGEDEAI